MKNHPEITKVTIEWECLFKKKTKKNYVLFTENYFLPHCLLRLKPRDTIRGAFSDVYALKWNRKENENETFYCTDVNGLYSYCAINFSYMTGKLSILIGQPLRKLQIINNKFYYNEKSVMGAIFLKILPPKNLYAPFLLYRKKDGTVVNTLCKMCAELLMKSCTHSEEDRSFIATYMTNEVELALCLGYKILQIYEAHIYTSKEPILRDFISKINFFKTKHSISFDNMKPEQKLTYCEYLNKKMQLSNLGHDFVLTPENIKYNASLRNYYKLLSNALFGKFIQRNDKIETKFIRSQDQLTKFVMSNLEIDDFSCPNENVCLLFIKKNPLKLPPNRKQNIYIGSQITAYAREKIYRDLLEIQKHSDFQIFQVECDSIFFCGPKDLKCPLPLSHAVGHYKIEYSEKITSYYSFGPKHYFLSYLDEDNTHKSICKYSGLNLATAFNEKIIDKTIFEKFIQNFILNQHSFITLNQPIVQCNFKELKISTSLQKFCFQNKISNRRIVDKSNIYLKTYPYGFF